MDGFFFLFSLLLLIGTTISTPTTTEPKEDKRHAKVAVESKGNENKTHNDTEIKDIEDEGWEYENTTVVDTRRILYGKRVKTGKRPYMVYLQLTKESAKAHKYRGWLCGGVIVDASYVLTSAACVEDAEHFYIVSGTNKFVDSFDYKSDVCVCKHRRRVVWKCIPKNYKFDFQDSIKWSSNDIAIVKVDKPFKFGVIEKGCQFATDRICYNNVSRELEKAGTKGIIAGWGSGTTFREGVYRSQHIPENAKCLEEAKVCIMDNEQCAKKWAQRFRNIITEYMICTRDVMKRLSEICEKKYANCTDVEKNRRALEESSPTDGLDTVSVDLGRHLRDPDDYTARRTLSEGGFCENDHGGPLIVKYRGQDRVVGVISACKIDPKSHSCHGPFLYTSVFRNRQFISCSIHKDVEENCRRVFRTGITHEEFNVDWQNIDDDRDEADGKAQDGADAKTQASGDSSDESSEKNLNKKAREESESESDSEVTQGKKLHDTDVKKQDAKLKTKKKKKHNKRQGRENNEKKEKKSGPGETKSKNQDKEVFYESSKDDNVNEPTNV